MLKKPSNHISFEKVSNGSTVTLTIRCNCNIKELKVVDFLDKEKIEFLRKNIIAGEILIFNYLPSKGVSKLRIHVEDDASSYDFSDNS
ncbi:MAG: hypothetical protein Q7S22_08130 [Candidatus Micrarchaeota archaeon]|nr:hypothetical protein [Candidatus Micrarchaeota archaeon]